MIVAVAMDADVAAARPWVDAAQPEFVTLVDENHALSELYNMVNVPQALWIDEEGRIVRPTETGGSLDILREFDFEQGAFPAEATARSQQAKATYLEAVKDWALQGSNSRYAYSVAEARQHVATMTPEVAQAHALFRLGQYLRRQGRDEEAEQLFAESRALHPDSWNIFRETTEKLDSGIAAGEAFWNKVMNLGDKQYYETIDLGD